jgi:2'-5' RNA ligase
MSRIAVDVALLPDREMTRRAIEINRELAERYGSEIVLGDDTRLPHISLAMGCVGGNDIRRIRRLLERLSREMHLAPLNAKEIVVSANSRGEYTSIIEIEKTAELQAVHERVMHEMEPIFSHDVNEAMIADNVVTGSTLDWIRNYAAKAAFERFSPHVTLGYGQTQANERFPLRFTVSRLALCHLGNHCTCRRILVAVDL